MYLILTIEPIKKVLFVLLEHSDVSSVMYFAVLCSLKSCFYFPEMF